MLTSDAPVDAGTSPDLSSRASRRCTRTRAPWVMVSMVMLLGCRPSGAASQAPNDVGTTQPPADPRVLTSDEPVGEAERDTTGERYLAEERWNAAASEEPELARADGRHPSGPTEAELQAWDRKDPERERHLYEWDAANFGRMQGYVHDLECFHALVIAAGESGRGAAPGTNAAKAWAKDKRELFGDLDDWQKQLFTKEPRILERSKLVQRLIEAHEVVAHELPRAYDGDDQLAIDRAEAHWMMVVAKVDEYVQNLGKTPSRASDAHCNTMRKS